jgi:hypothetical protein
MICNRQDWQFGIVGSANPLPPFYGHVYASSHLTPPGILNRGMAGAVDQWTSNLAPKSKPPAGTTADGRVQALIDKYGQGGTTIGQETPDIMQEVSYYVNGQSWVYCTINEYLNGTPSEDSQGGWLKRQFTAPCLEDYCGDWSYGDQYAKALEILASQGAPKLLIDWITTKSVPKLKEKEDKWRRDADDNYGKAWRAAGSSLNPFDPKSPLFYVVLGLGALLVVQVVRR